MDRTIPVRRQYQAPDEGTPVPTQHHGAPPEIPARLRAEWQHGKPSITVDHKRYSQTGQRFV